ncbi:phosphotransferase system sugar-specific EII component, partial [Streptococcus pneumoniae 2070335]
MVLDYFFDKNLVFCLEADNQEQLFDQVASLLEEREIVTPTYREALITREKVISNWFRYGISRKGLAKCSDS